MRVPLGVLQTGDKAYFELDNPAHMAISGMTRSGKTSFAYFLISSLAGFYPHVRMNIVDPSHVLGRPFNNHCAGGVLAMGFDSGAVLDVINHMISAMSERIDSLWDKRKDKFTLEDCPLEFLVIEELPSLVDYLLDDDSACGRKASEKIAPKVISGLRQILAQGLKVNCCVLVLAQRLDACLITGSARSNIGVKICLRAEDNNSIAMLMPFAPAEYIAEMRSAPPGRALISLPSMGESFIKLNHLSYSEYLDNLGV